MADQAKRGGLLDWMRSEVRDTPTGPKTERVAKPRALVASGVRVTRDNARIIGANRKTWQTSAWSFRSCVPELRFSTSFIANQVGRVRWFIAEDPGGGKDPVALTPTIDPEKDEKSRVGEYTRQVAIEALERLDLNRRGSSMAGRSAENFEYAGECYLLGMMSEDTGAEEWSIRSVSEMRINPGDNTVTLSEPGRMGDGQTLSLDNVAVYRLWNPDPEFHGWADAKIQACLGVLAEIVDYDRHKRAVVSSRIASGAMLYIPNELDGYRPGAPRPVDADSDDDDDGYDDADEDPMIEMLGAAWREAIRDESSPEALIPIVIRGDAMASDGQTPMKDCIGVVQIPREEIDEILKKREAAVTALATGLDFPPERMKGMGESNHWSAAQISDSEVSNHIEPRCEAFADSLTAAFLRGYLLAHNCPPDEVRWVCVWFDASELSQPADPWGRGKEAHTAGLISNKAARNAGDFTDADAPSPVEVLFRHLMAGLPTEQLAAAVELTDLDEDDRVKLKAAIEAAQRVAVERAEATARAATPPTGPRIINSPSMRSLDSAPTGTTENPASTTTPQTTTAPAGTPGPPRGAPASPPRVTITAAGTAMTEHGEGAGQDAPRWTVDRKTGRDLAQIDADLTTRFHTRAEAALERAVEKAGARIRSDATRHRTDPRGHAFRNDPKADPLAVIAAAAAHGNDLAGELSDDDLFGGAFDKLEAQWFADVEKAAVAVEQTISRLGRTQQQQAVTAALLVDPGRGVADRIRGYARNAWSWLKEKLRQRARDVLYGRTDGDVVPVALVRGAVAQTGGLPAGQDIEPDGTMGRDGHGAAPPVTGPGTGEVTVAALGAMGAWTLGHEWRHESFQDAPFEPHRRLDGVFYTDFRDPVLAVDPDNEWIGATHYAPGDHAGCRCSSIRAIALAHDGQGDPNDPQLDQLRADLAGSPS